MARSAGTYLGRKRYSKLARLYYVESANKGKTDWRVRSEPYSTKKEATAAVAWLRKNEPTRSHRVKTETVRHSWP